MKAGKLIGKWAKDTNEQFSYAENQTGDKYVKRTSTSRIIRKDPEGDTLDHGAWLTQAQIRPTTSFYK